MIVRYPSCAARTFHVGGATRTCTMVFIAYGQLYCVSVSRGIFTVPVRSDRVSSARGFEIASCVEATLVWFACAVMFKHCTDSALPVSPRVLIDQPMLVKFRFVHGCVLLTVG